MVNFQALILLLAIFAANFVKTSESQKNSAPFFDEGDNLSFAQCGKWNKTVSPEHAPWYARIIFDSSYWLIATVISSRTILYREILSEDERKKLQKGEMSAIFGGCRGKEICELDENEGLVIKVIDFKEYKEAHITLTLLIAEQTPEFTDFYSPICLFNKGNELDFHQQSADSHFESFIYYWDDPFQVKFEPLDRCLNNETITKMQNEEPAKLEWLVCVSKLNGYFIVDHLTYYNNERHFLRGQRAYGFYEMNGLNRSTHDLYYDFLPYLINWIAQNSPDIYILPNTPLAQRVKKFQGDENLSFPNCGQDRPKMEHGQFISNHRWHVEIKDNGESLCGGSLISRRAVLTAAHCLRNVSASEIKVALDGGQTKIPRKLIIHQNFNPKTFENDVALLILKEDLKLNPICLWNDAFDLDRIAGKLAMTVEWGTNETNRLQGNQLLIKSHKECYLKSRQFFGKRLKPGSNFCVENTNGTSFCTGGGGGGLFIEEGGRWFLRGIGTFNQPGNNETFCHQNGISLFTDLGGYMDWIVENSPDISFQSEGHSECGWWKKVFGKIFGSTC